MSRAVVVLLVLISLIAAPGLATDQGPVPEVSVSIDPPQQEAEVTQSELGEVTFQATIEIDQPLVTTSTLTLTAVMNTGWPVEVEVESVQVTGPTTVTSGLTVVVPASTSSLLTGNLIATATLKAPLLAPVQGRASALVTVSQYHKVRVEAEEPLVTLERGEETDVDLIVYNDGNGMATMRVSVAQVPEGVVVGLTESQFDVQQHESHALQVVIEVTNSYSGGTGNILILVESMGQGGQVEGSVTYPMFVKVETLGDDLGSTLVILVVVVAIVGTSLFLWRRRGNRATRVKGEDG